MDTFVANQITYHPASSIFELLDGPDFDALVKDIEDHGLRMPIWLHPDGSILDGRNRYRACIAADVEPQFETWEGDGSAADFVWSLNFTRRHLDGGAKQMAAGRYSVELEREARERQVAAGTANITGKSSSIEDDLAFGRSVEKAAEKFGIGRATVDRAVKVLKDGVPELGRLVEQDHVSVSAAADVASVPKARQQEIIAYGEKEILEAAKDIRNERAEAKRAQNSMLKAATPPPVFVGRYETIVIDPPWPMERIERDQYPNQVAIDYPTMSIDELADFALPDMAADNCHLFCWTTHKFLPAGLRLLETWDFRYVLTMVWHKPGGFQPFGLPQYNCEFVLYARRGSPTFIDTKAFPCCFNAPRREHSRKPDEFYDLVRRVTDGSRVDVFSREDRHGFAQYGNEVDKFGLKCDAHDVGTSGSSPEVM